jgi:predicted metal-dependent hydrolase
MTKEAFKAEVAAWAKRIGAQPAALRREVIVEELLHLKVPNHGKLSGR